MAAFAQKGYGRIYVLNPGDIQTVKDEIKTMNKREFDDYLPSDLIAPFSEFPQLAYAHKFDAIDLDQLTARLWRKGVYVFCLDNGHNAIFWIDED